MLGLPPPAGREPRMCHQVLSNHYHAKPFLTRVSDLSIFVDKYGWQSLLSRVSEMSACWSGWAQSRHLWIISVPMIIAYLVCSRKKMRGNFWKRICCSKWKLLHSDIERVQNSQITARLLTLVANVTICWYDFHFYLLEQNNFFFCNNIFFLLKRLSVI